MKKYAKGLYLFGGIAIATLFGIGVIALAEHLFPVPAGFFICSIFIIVPIVMGIICAWFWRNLELSNLAYVGLSLFTVFVAFSLTYLLLDEGILCLLIVSPLLLLFVITGAFIGKVMFRKKKNTLNVSVFSLLFFAFIIDSFSTHNYENIVSDTILIHAAPSEVWKHVVAFEPIKEPAHYFLFKMGMPSPVESTVDGYYEGAGRKCIFSNGYVFDEKMVIYKPGENLTFDITHQLRDPEIMGHIDILRGQFLLHDNGNGTTTLTGNSWYRLYVFPSWYYDLWAQSITRQVHLRAMQHIKELSETK